MLGHLDGIFVAPGFGTRGIDGTLENGASMLRKTRKY